MDNGKLISCRALKERGEVKTAINRERVTSGALGLHDHGRSCRRIFGSVIRVLSGVAVCPRVRAARIPGGATADTPDPKKLYTDLYLSIGFCGYAEISGDICLKSWRFANSLSPAISPRQVQSSLRAAKDTKILRLD